MPIYSFENTQTGEIYDKLLKIAEREVYLSENPHIWSVINRAPGIGDPVLLGIKKTPDSFNSLMKNIHNNSPGSKIITR